jgi:hypothetical protein
MGSTPERNIWRTGTGCKPFEELVAGLCRLARGALTMTQAKIFPFSAWSEDDGPVLWWSFPINEPPYIGTPNDCGHTVEVTLRAHDVDKLMRADVGGWPGYHTHWSRIPVPESPVGELTAEKPK